VVAAHPDPHVDALWRSARVGFVLRFTTEDYLWFPDIAPVHAAVREQWGCACIVLRALDVRVARPERLVEIVFLVQLLDAAPCDGQWLPAADIDLASLPAGDQSAVAAALPDVTATPPPGLRAWMQRGWFEEAVAWGDAALREHGIARTAPPEQLRTWGLSTVLRLDTTAGSIFFKSAAHGGALLFANEAALVVALAEHLPQHLPRPLAADAARVWLLLPDVGTFLYEVQDLAVWEQVVRLHARHQRSFIGREDDLLGMGCIDRRLSLLSVHLQEMLDDGALLNFLEDDQQAKFRAAAPQVAALVDELDALGIPPTLVHGDLHSGNVAVRDGVPVFFDWTDACLGHPFLDLVTLRDNGALEPIPGREERVVAVWREAWQGVVPDDALDRVLALIGPVGALHQAISYARMLPELDDASRNAMGAGGASWLRKLLDELSDLRHSTY
jgi:hypothetical protein